MFIFNEENAEIQPIHECVKSASRARNSNFKTYNYSNQFYQQILNILIQQKIYK